MFFFTANIVLLEVNQGFFFTDNIILLEENQGIFFTDNIILLEVNQGHWLGHLLQLCPLHAHGARVCVLVCRC